MPDIKFTQNHASDPASQRVTRRAFLGGTAAAATGGLLFWRFGGSTDAALAADRPAQMSGPVTVVLFGEDGKRLKEETLPKVVKSTKEWKAQLPGNVYDITRRADTEIAFTGKLWNNHAKGLYRCICCDTALFSSDTKFESGTGWPSFWQPIAKENVLEQTDSSFGMSRTAVACKLCDAHLGHVFTDGPQPTGLRYCMNSASLRFVPAARG